MTGSVIADTSAWVEFLRSTRSAADRAIEKAIRGRELLIAEPVLMELLAGARDEDDWQDIQRVVLSCELARLQSPSDWIDAAMLQRTLRLGGRTIASDLDCLIAVVAMRLDAAVLHKDADFAAIAEVAPLRIA